jgi:hypothetical protein
VLVMALWSGLRSGESVSSGRHAVNGAESCSYILQAYSDSEPDVQIPER